MQVDTAPAIKRTNRPKKRTTKTTTTTTGKKPTGVTKKRSTTKKTGVAAKVRCSFAAILRCIALLPLLGC
jgi:hypothetical protein